MKVDVPAMWMYKLYGKTSKAEEIMEQYKGKVTKEEIKSWSDTTEAINSTNDLVKFESVMKMKAQHEYA